MNSPVEIVELSEKYDTNIINDLYARRLIIRTGHKYAIYWAIFRDYLINGKLPVIPLTNVPTSNISTIFKAIQLLDKYSNLTKEEVATHLGVTPKTVQNIIGDLSIFMIIKKSQMDDSYLITDELRGKDKSGVSLYLYGQLRHHKIIQDILDEKGDSAKLTFKEYEGYMSDNYSSLGLNSASIHAYATRLLQWFSFSGLAYFDGEYIIVSHDGSGKLKGNITSRRGNFSRIQNKILFLCTSKYEDVVKIIYLVSMQEIVTNKWAKDNGLRNAAYDAVALGILERNKDGLVISDKYKKSIKPNTERIGEIVKITAMETDFLRMLSAQLLSTKNTSEIGNRISLSLGRNWSDASKIRYISTGKNWLRKFHN